MTKQFVKTSLRWQALGLLSGGTGAALVGALLGLFDGEGGLQAVATGAIVYLGIYLSSSFIWLPITATMIIGSTAV